jgi:hypothetical protein
MKNTLKLSTLSLNDKNYTRVTSNTVDTDLYDVNDFIRVGGLSYYSNKSNVRGVSKSIQRLRK